MNTMLECLPCLIRQAVDATTRMKLPHEHRVALLREVLAELSSRDLSVSPPAISAWINRRLRTHTGVNDPYLTEKSKHNQMAAELAEQWREEIVISPDPFYRALRIAIAGNVIDLGAKSELTDTDISDALWQAMSAPFDNRKPDFEQVVWGAERILYLTDNAGEIFFDRLLLERLPAGKVTVAVRGKPVLNDATREDAYAADLHTLAEVIDNGSDAPGTILEDCSPEFRERFSAADLIIAKGQGNYESLSHRQETIFFLFMAKCAVVADQLGVQQGTHILAGTSAALAGVPSC